MLPDESRINRAWLVPDGNETFCVNVWIAGLVTGGSFRFGQFPALSFFRQAVQHRTCPKT